MSLLCTAPLGAVMGGYGSSRWGCHWTRATTDGVLRLDVRELARSGQLRPNTCSLSSWTRNGEPAGSINLRAQADALILDYRSKGPADSDWWPVRERVPLDSTPCHYGGSRPWFLCPGCGRRRTVLYSVGGHFHCVRCHNLAYGSTQEKPWDRASRRADRLRRKIGADAGHQTMAPKPKGMHWRTYERIVSGLIACDRYAWALLAADTDAFLSRINHR